VHIIKCVECVSGTDGALPSLMSFVGLLQVHDG
jgi:hypothetical protein